MLAVSAHNLFCDHQGRCGEVDVVQVIFDDAVAGDDKQVAGTNRDFLRCQHFGYPVTDDPAGKARRRAHLDAGWVFGDQVGCHIADPDPAERVGLKIDACQCHRRPSGTRQGAVTALDQDVERLTAGIPQDLYAAVRRLGGIRAMAETIQYTDQGTGTVHVDREQTVAADAFARPRTRLGRPFDRPQPTVLSHCSESTSTSR